MVAANMGKADCAEALLEWGADKDAANSYGNTALHDAAYFGQLECARLLVRARADRAKKNNRSKIALELARSEWRRPRESDDDFVSRRMGRAEVAALLEQADANVSDSTPSQPSLRCSQDVFFGLRRAR